MDLLRDKHLYWIDGLKGLSALIVVLFHLCLALIGRDKFFIEYSESYLPVLRLFLNGNFAVSIFIIVSSVLLLKKLTSQNDKSNVLGTLIIKRYFRILYPVGFVILLMYILFYAGAFYAEQYGLQTHNSWLIGQFASISALPRYILLCPFGVTTPVLNVGWMLGYIFCGNILALILDMILGDKKILSTLILLVLVSVIIKYYMPIYYQNVVFAYMVVLYDRINIGKKTGLIILVIGALLILISEFLLQTEIGNMLRAMLFVFIVWNSRSLRTLLSSAIFRFLGHISLGMYILQLIVIYTFTCRFASYNNTFPYFVFNMIASLNMIILISWAFTKYIEPKFSQLTSSTVAWLQNH